MANRRQAVLDAAEKLIRRTGTLDFTMAALATAAGVSLATPYNLFDSKATVLYALLNKSMDGIDHLGDLNMAEADPVVRAMRASEAIAQFFTSTPAESAFYRALFQFLLGISDPVHRHAFMERSIQYWRRAADGLQQARLLPPELPHEQFAVEMMASYVGLTNLWVHRELDDDEYVARAGHAALVHMLGLARGRTREKVLELLQERQRRLPALFSPYAKPAPASRGESRAAGKQAAPRRAGKKKTR
jgi:AcrR family transcriptional regulator